MRKKIHQKHKINKLTQNKQTGPK